MNFSSSFHPSRVLAGGLLGLALAGGMGMTAWAAADEPPAHPHGPPMMGLMPPGGPMLDHLLDGIAATAQQRAQIHQIFDAARADLKAGHASARADHAQLAQAFAQPVVDVATLEAVRQRGVSRFDTDSKRLQQALVDAAQVLTPQQRQQAVALMENHSMHRHSHSTQPPSAPGG